MSLLTPVVYIICNKIGRRMSLLRSFEIAIKEVFSEDFQLRNSDGTYSHYLREVRKYPPSLGDL